MIRANSHLDKDRKADDALSGIEEEESSCDDLFEIDRKKLENFSWGEARSGYIWIVMGMTQRLNSSGVYWM